MDFSTFQREFEYSDYTGKADYEDRYSRRERAFAAVAARAVDDPERVAIEAYLVEQARAGNSLAVKGLEVCGAARYPDVFTELSQAGEPAVRLAAARGLRVAGQDAAARSVVMALVDESPHGLLYDLLDELAHYKGQEALDRLWRFVGHPDGSIRESAFYRIKCRILSESDHEEHGALKTFGTLPVAAVRQAVRADLERGLLEPYRTQHPPKKRSPEAHTLIMSVIQGNVALDTLNMVKGTERREALWWLLKTMEEALLEDSDTSWPVGGPRAIVRFSPPWARAALEELRDRARLQGWTPLIDELQEAILAMSHTNCPLCSDIPDSVEGPVFAKAATARGVEGLVLRIRPCDYRLQDHKKSILQCPHCGTHYREYFGYEYLATGSETIHDIDRLQPDEAHEWISRLEKANRIAFEEYMDQLGPHLEQMRAHPEQDSRAPHIIYSDAYFDNRFALEDILRSMLARPADATIPMDYRWAVIKMVEQWFDELHAPLLARLGDLDLTAHAAEVRTLHASLEAMPHFMALDNHRSDPQKLAASPSCGSPSDIFVP